jgi:hypothetical protein
MSLSEYAASRQSIRETCPCVKQKTSFYIAALEQREETQKLKGFVSFWLGQMDAIYPIITWYSYFERRTTTLASVYTLLCVHYVQPRFLL